MLIQSFRVQNYKSYLDTGEIKLSPGFNLIVGQNNVGKTALVEALSLQAPLNPHRSLKTMPTRQTPLTADGLIDHTLSLTREEGWQLLRELPPPLYIPAVSGESRDDTLARFSAQIEQGLVLRAEYSQRQGGWVSIIIGEQNLVVVQHQVYVARLRSDGSKHFDIEGPTSTHLYETVAGKIVSTFKSRLYAFKAERLNVSESPHGNSPLLQPDARNLAQVLSLLQTSNPFQWQKLLQYVRSIFPQITEITVPDKDAQVVRILVWSIPMESQRADLAIPLSDSGTGIGQVLAILYVVLTVDTPQTIIIDEPQSFLHPGAVRKLFDILRLYPHQFVVVTHSPTVVDAASPPTLLLIRNKAGESQVEALSAADADSLRAFLSEIGARPSDVFGSDRVLWVEGKTEEGAFPLIMASHPEITLGATAVLGVRHTGDFQRGDARAAVEIYKRLSEGPRLMPPTVGFILDRELLTPADIADLKRQTKDLVTFTQRRMFENYLLNARAIASVVNSIAGFSPTSLEVEVVDNWISEHRWDKEFFNKVPPEADRSTEFWLRQVDAGLLLQRMFEQLSEQRVRYDKPRHGLALTAWICSNNVREFDEIVGVVSKLLATSPDKKNE
jgi:hypothetical protein